MKPDEARALIKAHLEKVENEKACGGHLFRINSRYPGGVVKDYKCSKCGRIADPVEHYWWRVNTRNPENITRTAKELNELC